MDRWRIVCVQDAYKVMPFADVVYGCNPEWWEVHKECAGFRGERWSSHEQLLPNQQGTHLNDKRKVAEKYGIKLVKGRAADGFSFHPEWIHYGSNSGFQAINLALLFGCTRIVLVGFDMRHVDGKSHFFGDHPQGLHTNRDEHYRAYIPFFAAAAKRLPAHVSIVNATPNSALKCFPSMSLEDACRSEPFRPHGRVPGNGAEPHAAAG